MTTGEAGVETGPGVGSVRRQSPDSFHDFTSFTCVTSRQSDGRDDTPLSCAEVKSFVKSHDGVRPGHRVVEGSFSCRVGSKGTTPD